VPASQATSSRIAGRHHLGISGRLRRNLQLATGIGTFFASSAASTARMSFSPSGIVKPGG
jgi:hypothetical protein